MRFDTSPQLIGNVGVPENIAPKTTTYGEEMARRIAEEYKLANPKVPFEFNVGTGQRGPDGAVPPDFAARVGWSDPWAEIKPNTGVQTMNKYDNQFNAWTKQYEPDFGVQVLSWDYSGNVYKGFVTPTWVNPPSPAVPVQVPYLPPSYK